MRKCCSKVGAIDVRLPRALWEEESMTSGTKDIDCVVSRQIGKSYWQYWLTLAKNTWASSKRRLPILFIHCVHPSIRNNVAEIILTTEKNLSESNSLQPFHK
jgi:hypothetical protein